MRIMHVLRRPAMALPDAGAVGQARMQAWCCGVLVFVAYAGLLTQRGWVGPGTLLAVMALIGFGLFLRCRDLDRDEAVLMLSFAVLPVYYLFNLMVTGWDSTQLDKPLRMLLAIPVVYLISRWGLSSVWLVLGVVCGAVTAAALAAHQVWILGIGRADGVMNAIPFGSFALLLASFAAAGWVCLPGARTAAMAVGTLVAILAGLTAAVLSGTRGVWLAAPVLLGLLAWAGGLPARVIFRVAGLCSLVALVVVGLHPRSREEIDGVLALLGLGLEDQAGMVLSSTGVRLHLYRVALEAFASQPVLGIGLAGLPTYLQAGVEAGWINPAVTEFTHLHSAPLDMLARGGLLGLIALGLLLWGLGAHFARGVRQAADDPQMRYFALCGLMATVGALLFALTNVFFPAIVGTHVLVLSLAVPAGGMRWRQRARRTAQEAVDGGA